MCRKERKWIGIGMVFVLALAFYENAFAMHIMEGYLSPVHSALWGLVCIPFLLRGYGTIRKHVEKDRKNLTLLAMSGAFIFVLSSLKIPSVTGSCSHMTGTGLAAVLFGPGVASILGLIVLIFQALLLAHGGLTTLGANTFSMAIMGPILAYFLYQLCRKSKVERRLSIFLAAFAGDLLTYCVTSLQLALAYPSESGGFGASALKFLAVFAPTQLPLAIIEGILTVLIVMGLEIYAKSELSNIGFLKEV